MGLNNDVGILFPYIHTALGAASPVAVVFDSGSITSTMLTEFHL